MSAAEQDRAIDFGPFRLHKTRRNLSHGSSIVRLGGRATDVLLALAERRGELVSKQDLLAAGWPDTVVEEANLKVTIRQLRDALRRHEPSHQFIHTVVGRGYWLSTQGLESSQAPPSSHKLDRPEEFDIIGRDDEVTRLGRLLRSDRLVTVVGAGGVGKTTLTRAVVGRLEFAVPVTFVDLSHVSRPEFVAASLAAALGVRSGQDRLEAICSILADERRLLVLDSCEHVADAVSLICERLLARTAHVQILATSRQVLGTRAETLFWLIPLASPTDERSRDLAGVLTYSAPRLLVARAARKGYAPEESQARSLAAICRRLDGLPLAIELVAPRLATRGAGVVLDELDQSFLRILGSGKGIPRRQKTLSRTLRWSYDLLTLQEASLLRAVSVFAGEFDSEAATVVGASVSLTSVDVSDALASLRAKSMLSAAPVGTQVRYRLLDSTRSFAREILDACEETVAVSGAHARLVLTKLRHVNSEQATLAPEDWRRLSVVLIDDLRAAIDWTLNRSADPRLGMELVAAGLPLCHELSLGQEIRSNCTLALAEFHRTRCSDLSLKLRLVVGLAAVSTYLSADTDETVSLFQSAVDLAREIGDPLAECRAVGAFATYQLMRGRAEDLPVLLSRMAEAAARSGDPSASWEQQQLRVQYDIRTSHFAAAFDRIRNLHDEIGVEATRAAPRFQIHQKINVQIQLAALCWLTGRPDEARGIAETAAAEARQISHGITLIHALAQGVVWTLIQCGDYAAVPPKIELLNDAIYEHGMAAWIPVSDTYAACVAAFLGQKPDPACLRSAFYGVRKGMAQIQHDARYAIIAQAMLANGQPKDAADVIEHVLRTTSSRPWGLSEFLRLQAATERAAGNDDLAMNTLIRSAQLAKQSRSIAWALRSTLDLAQLLKDRGDFSSARSLLKPIYDQFAEGQATGDLRAASELLSNLHEVGEEISEAL